MEYYDSIDNLPMWNFDKIHETGELKYLFVKCKGNVTPKIHDIWAKINNELFEITGVPKNTSDIIRMMQQSIDYRAEYVRTKQPIWITKAEIIDRQIELKQQQAQEKQSVSKYAFASKHMPYQIRPKEITVKAFYELIHYIANEQQ